MTALEDVWQRKTDDQLLEALDFLEEYSDAAQRVIRAECRRRGLANPPKPSISFEEASAVARVYRRFMWLVAVHWLALPLAILAAILTEGRDPTLAGLMLLTFIATGIAAGGVGSNLFTQLDVDGPDRTDVPVYKHLKLPFALIGVRYHARRWSHHYGIELGVMGPTRESLDRLRETEQSRNGFVRRSKAVNRTASTR